VPLRVSVSMCMWVSTGVVPGDGLATWEKLMTSIRKTDEVERTRGSLSDRMLTEWCRVRLIPPVPRSPPSDTPSSTPSSADAETGGGVSEAVAKAIAFSEAVNLEAVDTTASRDTPPSPVSIGSVLRSGRPADRFLLSDQFLHKALLLVAHELPDGGLVCCVLNRPTANLVQFHSEGKPRRCISFGGDGRLRGGGLEIDSNGLMWLGQASSLDRLGEGGNGMGAVMGTSGLRRVQAMEAAESIKAGDSSLDDFLLISGLVCLGNEEIRQMLADGEMHIVEDATPLWPQVFALANAATVESEVYGEGGALLSDGTGVWWAAAQLEKRAPGGEESDEDVSASVDGGIDALLAGLQAMPPAHLADEALAEWLKFFAGHKQRREEER